jgi:hypothetical protein
MISLAAVFQAVIILIVAGVIFWLLTWLIDYCQIPEPFRRIARVVLAIAAVVVVIGVLLSLAGVQVFR